MSQPQITLEDAYREACTALGESIVQQRLLGAEVQRLQQASDNQSDPCEQTAGEGGEPEPP